MYKIKLNRFRRNKSMKACISIDKLSIVIALLLVLNSCTFNVGSVEPTPIIDKNSLTGEMCDSPCWHGLHINESSKKDVLSTLDQLPFINHNSYKEYETLWVDNMAAEEIQFTCTYSKSACGGALISSKVLKRFWVVMNSNWPLQNAVDQLGIPESLEYFWPSPSGDCTITVYWVNQGVSVKMYDNKNYNQCESIADGNGINPEIAVYSIIYFSEESFGLPGKCCERIAWPGFKSP